MDQIGGIELIKWEGMNRSNGMEWIYQMGGIIRDWICQFEQMGGNVWIK